MLRVAIETFRAALLEHTAHAAFRFSIALADHRQLLLQTGFSDDLGSRRWV
jgi:hypothetical protein